MRAVTMACCLAALVASLAPSARADEWNKKTYLTFSGPVQIPGTTLPAGTYTFELADPDMARHVVRVSSQDGTKTYGMFLTIPNERLEPPDDNIVMFAERPAGSPKAIQVWFYPGDRTGEEFVYPRKQAVEIAKAAHQGVLSTDETLSGVNAAKNAKVNRIGPTTAPRPTTAPTKTSPATATAGSAPSVGTTGRKALPGTASNLTAFGLLSGLALAGAFGAHQLRRRIDAQ